MAERGRLSSPPGAPAAALGEALPPYARPLPFRACLALLALAASACAADVRAGVLRVAELQVPARLQLGTEARAELRCDWALPPGAALYSAKWYKDGQEFFRYMPDDAPPALAFPVPGVQLQEGTASAQRVTLVNVTVATGGLYRCEVSTEGPAFHTAYAQQRMAVQSPPPSEPEVSGVQDSYAPGDEVRANCTAGRSHPPPQLTWYINGIKAERWFPGSAPVPLDDADAAGLVRRTLPLIFRAERRLFQGAEGRLELRCQAVAGQLRWTRLLSPALAAPDAAPPAPHQTELREMPGARPPPHRSRGGPGPRPGAAMPLLLLPSALAAAAS